MKDYKTTFLLFLLAVLLITLSSRCSWIYPQLSSDYANAYMSIGRSMLSGKQLYTEVFGHKGPLFFFFHEWAAALSSETFFGIYLLEILCCFGFLVFSYKTMRMFAGHYICLITTCAVGVLTYSSEFILYGDTVEEFSLPILLYVLYRSLLYAKLGKLPKNGESVLIGMGIAAIFWMKFTLLAMCVGALVSLLVLAWRRGQMLLLLQCLSWIIAGAGGLTACVLLYFVAHGNESGLYQSYFYYNLFENSDAGVLAKLWCFYLVPLKWACWALLVGAVLLVRVPRDVKLVVAMCWGAQLLIFVLFKIHLHNLLPVFVFAPLMIHFVCGIRHDNPKL